MRAAGRQRPVVVIARGEDELQLVARSQQIEIFPAVFRRFAGARRLEIDDARDTRIDAADVERTTGFERNRVAGIAQGGQQRQTVLLRQRFAAGDADRCAVESGDTLEDVSQA